MTESATVYPKAPVVEAVIDIQVRLGEGGDECVTRLSEELGGRFPQKNEMHLVEMELRPDGTSVQRNAIGWRLTNVKGDRVLQVRRQGFTYSHMSPYTHWSVFSGEARSLWAEFVQSCSPDLITRVAVRYINRLKLPRGPVKLEDYLAVYPMLPSVYEPVQGLLLQVQGRHEAIDPFCKSVVTIASEQSSEPAFQPMLLDIDVSVEKELKPTENECWNLLERLRVRKNELFEAAITSKLRETFK